MVRTRRLGRTGLTVSEIGFGGAPAGLTNYLGRWDAASEAAAEQIVQTVRRAADLGVTYFDTAPGYGQGLSESMVGRALRGRRAGMTVATKVTGDDADAVFRSVEASLQRLGVEQIDVLQYHGGWYTDEQVANILKPGGALAGMQRARDEGLVRFLGFTTEGVNGQASQLLQTDAFDVIQLCYNLIHQHPYDPSRHAGLIFEAAERGLGIITMRSLTSGTFQRWLSMLDPGFEDRVDLHRALLAFVLANPLVSVALVGMRTPAEAEANVAASLDDTYRLDPDVLHERYVDRRRPA
ncbi:MAG: aldo/keto reductase [Chloroflexi bacterium]|nr:aldo/keto reductase [Chloroflexota bacterium]